MEPVRLSYGNIQNSDSPGPEASIRLSNPSNPTKSTKVVGIVDSAAVMTCIPESKIGKLGQLTYGFIKVRDVSNHVCQRKTYIVDIHLEGEFFPNIEVIATPKNYALIGRDILNQEKVMFDAEHDLWVYACPQSCPISDSEG